MIHHGMLMSLYMVRNYDHYTVFKSSSTTCIGPPILQAINPVYYVIAGEPFTLNCTAANDPQSPNKLRFRWFKESTKIDDQRSQWNISEMTLTNTLTVTSQIVITNLTVEQHNGTYMCSVDNYRPRTAVDQTTIVVVESKCCFM